MAERLELQEIYDGVGDYAAMTEEERRALAEQTFLPRPDRLLRSSQYTLDAHFTLPFAAMGKHILVVGGQAIDGELEDGVFGMESGQPGGVQEQKMFSLVAEDSWTVIDPLT